MIQLFRNPNWDFIGKRRWAYLISAIFIAIGLVSLAIKGGLPYDIDFAGGTLIQVRFEKPPSVPALRASLARVGLGEGTIQQFGDPQEYIIRLPLAPTGAQEMKKQVEGALGADPALGKFEIRRVEFVGPKVGRDLQMQAVWAILVSLGGILLYIAMRFDLKGGVAAVIAVFHDVMVCVTALSLTNREFSLDVLAAILTIIGYSVNDTIVSYDRLRENRGKLGPKGQPFAQQMNTAVNQTLSRTILTALTVFITTSILLFFGGKVLENMAFTLFVGVITGTYSTIYIAGALVVDWTTYVEGRMRARKKAVAKA